MKKLSFAADNAPLAGSPPVQVDLIDPGESVLSPVAGLVLISGTNTFPDVRNNSRLGVGLTDGTTQRAVGWTAENGGASLNQDCHTRNDTATIINLPVQTAGTLDTEARFDSFLAGVLRLQFDDLPATTACLLQGLFFYDCPAALVDFAGNALQNSANSVTSLSFEPDMVISVSHFNAYAADGTAAGRRQSIGVAVKTPTGAVQQVCHSKYMAANITTTSYASALRDDAIVDSFTPAADLGQLQVTAWLSNGAEITTRRAAGVINTALLFLKTRRRLWAGIPAAATLDTNATGVKAITDPGFKGRAYMMFATSLATKNATDLTASSDGWSIGAHSADDVTFTDGWSIGGFERDAVATCATRSVSHSKVARVLLNTTPTDDWSALHSSYDALGISVNIDTASAADRLAAFVVIGTTPESPKPKRARHRQGKAASKPVAGRSLGGARHATSLPVGQITARAADRVSPAKPGHHGGTAGRSQAQPAAQGRAQAISARAPPVHRAPGTKAESRFGSVLREMTRFRIARLVRMRWRPELTPQDEEIELFQQNTPKGTIAGGGLARGRIS